MILPDQHQRGASPWFTELGLASPLPLTPPEAGAQVLPKYVRTFLWPLDSRLRGNERTWIASHGLLLRFLRLPRIRVAIHRHGLFAQLVEVLQRLLVAHVFRH